MASDKEKREKLVKFLDEKAFDPILNKSASDFPEGHKREMFMDVKRSTENEKKRFHDDYPTAEDVKNNYLSDLSSQVAQKKNSELEELGLPRMYQFHDEFMKLCDQLGV